MGKRLVVIVDGATPVQLNAIAIAFQRGAGDAPYKYNWGHYLSNVWFLSSATGNLSAAAAQGVVHTVAPGVAVVALDLDEPNKSTYFVTESSHNWFAQYWFPLPFSGDWSSLFRPQK